MTRIGLVFKTTGSVIIRMQNPDGTYSEGTRYEAGTHELFLGIGQGYTLEVHEAMIGEQTLTEEEIRTLEEKPQLPALD